MDQPTFHALYEQMPDDFKAELIGGVVYVASPAKTPHGRKHRLVITWMGNYSDATPGTDCLADTTTILGDDSEPQPDCGLLVIGGQTHEDEDNYLIGPPELLAESAD
ncbi:MAG TPA: Uma2 family endonuclease, partial [Planctomycetaceae bacterium]|nr:Uma2 family endonuclease [Planctomycetaceae bacterium]